MAGTVLSGMPVAVRPHRGRWPSPGYRSGRQRATWAKWLLVVAVGVSILTIVVLVYGVALYATAERTDDYTEWFEWFCVRDGAIGWCGIALVASAIAFLAWLSRTVEIAPPLWAGTPAESPRAAIGWWFVPIAALVKPYFIVVDLFDRMAPGDERSDHRLAIGWWLAWVGSYVLRVCESVLIADLDELSRGRTIERLRIVMFVDLAAVSLLAIAGSALIRLVLETQRRTEARALALGLEAPEARWAGPPMYAAAPAGQMPAPGAGYASGGWAPPPGMPPAPTAWTPAPATWPSAPGMPPAPTAWTPDSPGLVPPLVWAPPETPPGAQPPAGWESSGGPPAPVEGVPPADSPTTTGITTPDAPAAPAESAMTLSCPRCGATTTASDVMFCARCGLRFT